MSGGRLARLLPALALGAAVLAFYGRALGRPFTSEDFLLIRYLGENPPWHHLFAQLSSPWLGISVVKFYRPVSTLLYGLEIAAFGGHPLGYNVVHLLVHGVNVALVWGIVRRLDRGAAFTPWAVALLFALYPLHPNAVVFSASFATLYGAAFLLGSVLAYQRFREAGSRAAWGASLALFVLALGSYEESAVLPGLLVAYDHLIGVRAAGGRRHAGLALGYLPFFGLLGLYLLLRRWIFGVFVGGYDEYSQRLLAPQLRQMAHDLAASVDLLHLPVFDREPSHLGAAARLLPARRRAARPLVAAAGLARRTRSPLAVRLGVDARRAGPLRLPAVRAGQRALLVPGRGGGGDERGLPGARGLRRRSSTLAEPGAGGGRAPRRRLGGPPRRRGRHLRRGGPDGADDPGRAAAGAQGAGDLPHPLPLLPDERGAGPDRAGLPLWSPGFRPAAVRRRARAGLSAASPRGSRAPAGDPGRAGEPGLRVGWGSTDDPAFRLRVALTERPVEFQALQPAAGAVVDPVRDTVEVAVPPGAHVKFRLILVTRINGAVLDLDSAAFAGGRVRAALPPEILQTSDHLYGKGLALLVDRGAGCRRQGLRLQPHAELPSRGLIRGLRRDRCPPSCSRDERGNPPRGRGRRARRRNRGRPAPGGSRSRGSRTLSRHQAGRLVIQASTVFVWRVLGSGEHAGEELPHRRRMAGIEEGVPPEQALALGAEDAPAGEPAAAEDGVEEIVGVRAAGVAPFEVAGVALDEQPVGRAHPPEELVEAGVEMRDPLDPPAGEAREERMGGSGTPPFEVEDVERQMPPAGGRPRSSSRSAGCCRC